MRILSIRIRNLNSLAGDWTIRLDGPEYESGGIFAITGPTGAGKSTILDAVCLALYGCTPRLGKVAKSGNEIMSRQTADCLAEVRFRTPKGEFLCSWSQNKAGRRTGGNLQQPRHRLYDAEGLSVAEKTTEVVEKVTELTGMNFNRFTQSMLLAQGRFASFLLADGDDRAPLLEQITGTEIYAEISKKIHERDRDEGLRLAALDEELASKKLLSEEQERQMTQELEELTRSASALAQEAEARRRDMARLDRAAELDREAQAVEAEREKLRCDEAAFDDGRRRLMLARKAAGLSGLLEAAAVRRQEEARDKAQRLALARELPRLDGERQEAEKRLSEARTSLEEARAAMSGERALWTRVRALDTELEARRRELTALDGELAGRDEALRTRERARDAAERARREAEEALNRIRTSLEEGAADEALGDETGVMQTRLAMLEKETEALDRTRRALTGALEKLETLRAGLAGRRKAAAAAEEELARTRTLRDEALAQLDALLAGREASSLRREKDALSERKNLLEKALEDATARRGLLEEERKRHLEAGRLALKVRQEEAELLAGRERLTSLRQTLELQRRIRSYEEERRHLREGQPCPLCGSLEHPFALSGTPGAADDEEKRLVADLERKLEALTADLASHRRDAVHVQAALKENGEAKARLTEELRELMTKLSFRAGGAGTEEAAVRLSAGETEEVLSALSLTEEAPQLIPLLERLHGNAGAALEETVRTLSGIGVLEERHRKLERLSEELTRRKEDAVREEADREKEEVRLVTETQNLGREVARGKEKVEEQTRALCAATEAFGERAGSLEDLRRAVAALAARRDGRAALRRAEAGALQKLHECSRTAAVAAEGVDAASREQEEARRTRTERADAVRTLAKTRASLFGSRRPEEEEKASERRVQAREEAEKRCRETLEKAERALAESRSADAALERGMAQRAQDLRDLEALLDERLTSAGFADEASCQEALLKEEEVRQLERREQALAERGVGLDTRMAELARRRQEDEAPLPPREATERALEELNRRREEVLQRTGSVQEKLSANEAQRGEAQILRQRREAQAAICRRWDVLEELAGSAEGKKFRNYAQELTFRRLLVLANRQLAFMTDRYVLVHSTQEKLTLNVIDRYQADAVRSSRNLSGGESFLVSLSLALGLSQMASRNVRVDSVFLDEGFGTLDEEALNTALDMLAALHRRGKMIGIISHVQAVRERIGLQIRVSPEGGGKSRVSGPGAGPTKKDA